MRRLLGKTAVSLKAMVYGKEGSHKSNTAIQFATLKDRNGKPLKVLLIDSEFKSVEGFNEAWLEEQNVDFGNICEIRTRDMDLIYKLCECFTKGKPIPVLDENDNITKDYELDAEGNPFIADVLIMDSISVLQDLLVEGRTEIIKKRANIKIIKEGMYGDEAELYLENTGMQFLDYAKLKSKALKLIRDLQAVTGKHVVYVARAKDAKESKLVNGKMEQIDLGFELMDATSFKFLPYEVNLIVHTKNTNGTTIFEIEKDSTGVKKQGDVLTDFSMKDYENYINNVNRKELIKTKTYAENIEKAKAFTEDSEESSNDIKLRLYKMIVGYAKEHKEAGALIKNYCSEHNISGFGTPELISLDDLTEIRKILNI